MGIKSYFILSVLLGFFMLPVNTFAAFHSKMYGPPTTALAGSGRALFQPDYAVFVNPATAFLDSSRLGRIDLGYRNFYGLQGIQQLTLSCALAVKGHPLGFGFSRYGNNLYAENELRMGYNFALGPAFRVGASLNVYALEIRNYGQAQTFGFDVAGIYIINSVLRTAFVLSNLHHPEIGRSGERINPTIAGAFVYQPVESMQLAFDIVNETDIEFDYRLGLIYNYWRWLKFRAGVRQNVDLWSVGLEAGQDTYAIHYTFEYHMQLGASHAVGFSYAL
ncbi:MAG: hypothetical protein GF313_10020 [Caldithrix sp.]|nr:hypothetical protein [Caldithrix sp.]